MLRAAEKKKAVIYRHPRGRFEIVETSWVNADGSSVRIRETVMTPQHDERGILSSADLQVKIAQQAPDPKEHKTSFKRIEGATRDRLIEMFDKGCPLSQIAETLGYSVSGIRYFVKSNNLTREKPPRRKSVNQIARKRVYPPNNKRRAANNDMHDAPAGLALHRHGRQE